MQRHEHTQSERKGEREPVVVRHEGTGVGLVGRNQQDAKKLSMQTLTQPHLLAAQDISVQPVEMPSSSELTCRGPRPEGWSPHGGKDRRRRRHGACFLVAETGLADTKLVSCNETQASFKLALVRQIGAQQQHSDKGPRKQGLLELNGLQQWTGSLVQPSIDDQLQEMCEGMHD